MPITTNQKIKDLAQQMIARDFLDISDSLVVVMNSFGQVVMVNEKACRVFGYREKDLVGKSWFSFITKEEIKIIKPHFIKLFQGKVKIKKHYESLMFAKNGEQKNACWSNHLLRDEQKRPVGILSFGQDITEYRKLIAQKIISEEKIKNSELLYHSLVDSVRFGVEIMDKQGTILFQNKFLENKLGKEAIGKKCWIVYRDNKKRCFDCPLQKKVKIGQKGVIEADGCLHGRTLLIDYTVINYQGKLALLKIIQDVTEKNRLEKVIKDSAKKYEDITTFSPVGIFQTNTKGECLYVNKRWCEIAGFTLKQALGTGWVKGIHPSDRDMVFKAWNKSAKTGTEFYLEYRFMTPKGVVTWVLGRADKTLDDNGKVIGYLGTISDISEIKKIEERLKNSEEKFKIVAEQMPDALFIFDLEDKKVPFRIMDVNKTACKMHGYSREELIGKSISWLDDTDSAKKIPQRRTDLLKGKSLNFEAIHRRKNKTTFPVEVHMRQVELHGKKIAIAVDHDISDRKKVEIETVNYNKELERLNDLLVGRELKMIELKEKIKKLEELV